jgi:beta-lactamase class D
MRKVALILFVFVLAACSGPRAVNEKEPTIHPEFKAFFDEYGVDGCFILYDVKADSYHLYNPNRCEEGFLPASTFKILNALIALETQVAPDENFTLPWDSVVRTPDSWNRAHTLESAMRYSVIPYYQEIARRIGPERMKQWVEEVNYGRMDITTESIDHFWLWGKSRITPWEQMDFMDHFYFNQLPFEQRNIDIVKKMIVLDKTDQWTFRGKTGWTTQDGRNIGWFVGYLEEKGRAWLFVCNVETDGNNISKFKESRIGITEKVLKSIGLMQK